MRSASRSKRLCAAAEMARSCQTTPTAVSASPSSCAAAVIATAAPTLPAADVPAGSAAGRRRRASAMQRQ